MNLRNVLRISIFDFRHLLRDTHTLIYSIAIPLFLYPMLFLGLTQILMVAQGASEQRVVKVAVAGAEHFPELVAHLGEQPKLEVIPRPGNPRDSKTGELSHEIVGHWLRQEKLDALVVPEGNRREGIQVEVLYSTARDGSGSASRRVGLALEEFRTQLLLERAREIGQGEEFLDPLEVELENLTPLELRVVRKLALALPIFFLLMIALGAFYPALDSTAGERERGTIETTLLLPVSRGELILGKYIPVVCFALIALASNLFSMALALWFFLYQNQIDIGVISVPDGALPYLLAAAVLLALLIGAVMMAVALLAQSFKEGQGYLGPIMLIVTAPGVAAVVEQLELTPILAVTPLLNLSLTIRDALREQLNPVLGGLSMLTSAGYTALAILFASRLAHRESVLLGTASTEGWRGTFRALLPRGRNSR